MADINLLPEELRKKEQKEIETVRKKPRVLKIKTTTPPKLKPRKEPKKPKKPFWKNLFAKKTKVSSLPAAELPLQSTAGLGLAKEIKKKEGKRKLKLSKAKGKPALPDIDLLKKGLATGEESKPKPVVSEPKVPQPEVKPEIKLPEKSAVKKELTKSKTKKEKIKLSRKKFNLFSFLKFFFVFKTKKKPLVKKPEKPRLKAIKPELIPAELAKYPELELPKRFFILGLAVFLTLLLIAVVYLGIAWHQLRVIRQVQLVQTEIKSLNNQIALYEKNKSEIQDLQNQLRLIKDLLENHVHWTKFFEFLEQYTIDDVYYTNFVAGQGGGIVLSAVGKDYQSIARQLKAFQQAPGLLESVAVNSASLQLGEEEKVVGVNFSIDLTLNPEIFIIPFAKD